MASFASAPVSEVRRTAKAKNTGVRAAIAAEYRNAFQATILDEQLALIVELGEGEQSLTVRNRILAAAKALDVDPATVKVRKQTDKETGTVRVVAYLNDEAAA